MKKQILVFLGITLFIFVGCGGGSGGTSVSYDDPKVIENQEFFRVKKGEEGDFYIKELFDENNSTLYEGKYFDIGDDNDSLVSDTNETTPYTTDLTHVHIAYDSPISCRVIETNNSVEFYCLPTGASGSLSLYTIRWKTLEDARFNSED